MLSSTEAVRSKLSDEYGYAGSDTPHRMVVGGSYELPIGRGKLIGTQWGNGLNRILGGWKINGSITLQDGQPINFTAGDAVCWAALHAPTLAATRAAAPTFRTSSMGRATTSTGLPSPLPPR